MTDFYTYVIAADISFKLHNGKGLRGHTVMSSDSINRPLELYILGWNSGVIVTVLCMRYFCAILCLTLATSLFGCMNQRSSSDAETLRFTLLTLGGQYTKDLQGKYHYSEKIKLDSVITKDDQDRNLKYSVSCMDDETPSKTLLEGKAVVLGVICNQAATLLGYYEHTDKQGETTSHWPGYIAPTATIEELRSAKKAWLNVLENKTYIKL